MSKPTKSSTSVLARVKLLHSYLWAGVGWVGSSTNRGCHKTPRGLISKGELPLPA